jgi:O-succinylbenzoate synthase
LKRLREQFSVNLALDDSARDDVWREARIRSKVYQTVVVKPALFGLTTRIRRIAQVAGECGAQIVVTSFMESSVGIYYAAQAAAAYGTLGIAHGLETAGLLSDDVLSEPLAAEQGELLLPDCANLAARLKPRYRSELGIDG